MEILVLLFFAIVILAVIGWVMNIVKIFTSIHKPITGLFILRIVGIFVPIIGSIVGWL